VNTTGKKEKMQMTQDTNSNKNWKKNAKKKGPAKPWKQRFGPGMLVEHEKLGLGAVTSSFKWHICVHFFMTGHAETVNQRELSFTREENARRRKLARAFECGRPVASDSRIGDRVVHELNGFGKLLENPPEMSETVLVSFENDYIDGAIEIDKSQLRIDVPVIIPEPEKKNRNRRR